MKTDLPMFNRLWFNRLWFIRLWFAADVVLALFPPLQWWAADGAPVAGVPHVIVYLFGTSVFIAASVVVAYFCDGGRATS